MDFALKKNLRWADEKFWRRFFFFQRFTTAVILHNNSSCGTSGLQVPCWRPIAVAVVSPFNVLAGDAHRFTAARTNRLDARALTSVKKQV